MYPLLFTPHSPARSLVFGGSFVDHKKNMFAINFVLVFSFFIAMTFHFIRMASYFIFFLWKHSN